MIKSLLCWSICFLILTGIAFSQSPFWVPTAGPLRISVSAIATNSEGHVFAGTYIPGMYRSTDYGNTWVQINNGLPLVRIYAITISRAQENFNYIFVATRATGVYRSSDNGESWHRAGLADTNTYIESICADMNGDLYASSHHTVNNVSSMYRSTNNGATWHPAEVDNPLVHTNIPFILCPTMGKYAGQIFAGTNWGVYKSQDRGENWERVVPVGANFQVNSFAVNYRGDMYAAATDSAVYKSDDGGLHWTKVGVTIDKVLSLTIAPNGVLFAATYGSGMFRSLDDGVSWHSLDSGLDNELMLSVTYVDAGVYDTYIYAGGTGLGTFRSRHSTTPFSLNKYEIPYGDVEVGEAYTDSILVRNMDTTTLTINAVYATHKYFTVRPTEVSLAVGESRYFYVTFAPAWYGPASGTVQFISTANSSPDEVLINGIGRAPDTHVLTNRFGYGRVFLGTYADQTVRIKNIGNDTLNVENLLISDSSIFSVWPDQLEILPGEFLQLTIRFTPLVHRYYQGFVVLQSNSISSPDTIWMDGYGRGYPRTVYSMHAIMFGNLRIGKNRDTSMTLSNTGVDTLWISRVTSNNSQFSVKIDKSPLPPGESRRFTISFHPFAKGETFGTIYFYSNALSSPDSILVHGLGDPLSNIETLEGTPTEFLLYQNYPNPFNPSTTIRFGMAEEGGVKINIYDTFGREIAVLTNEVLPQGFYETHWTNNGYPSGVYYYRIVVRSIPANDIENNLEQNRVLFDQIKRLVLIK